MTSPRLQKKRALKCFIAFPTLDKAFSDYLADIIEGRTNQSINREAFYQVFAQMNYTPLYLRAVAQDIVLNPELSLEQAVSARLSQLNDTEVYTSRWQGLNPIDRAILVQIASGVRSLYARPTLEQISKAVGTTITNSQTQASLKRLTNKDIIAKNINGDWIITEQALKTWIMTQYA